MSETVTPCGADGGSDPTDIKPADRDFIEQVVNVINEQINNGQADARHHPEHQEIERPAGTHVRPSQQSGGATRIRALRKQAEQDTQAGEGSDGSKPVIGVGQTAQPGMLPGQEIDYDQGIDIDQRRNHAPGIMKQVLRHGAEDKLDQRPQQKQQEAAPEGAPVAPGNHGKQVVKS